MKILPASFYHFVPFIHSAGASANKLTLADLRMLFDLDRPVTMPTNFQSIQGIATHQFNNR